MIEKNGQRGCDAQALKANSEKLLARYSAFALESQPLPWFGATLATIGEVWL